MGYGEGVEDGGGVDRGRGAVWIEEGEARDCRNPQGLSRSEQEHDGRSHRPTCSKMDPKRLGAANDASLLALHVHARILVRDDGEFSGRREVVEGPNHNASRAVESQAA